MTSFSLLFISKNNFEYSTILLIIDFEKSRKKYLYLYYFPILTNSTKLNEIDFHNKNNNTFKFSEILTKSLFLKTFIKLKLTKRKKEEYFLDCKHRFNIDATIVSQVKKNPSLDSRFGWKEEGPFSLWDTIVCRRRWNDIPESAHQSFYTGACLRTWSDREQTAWRRYDDKRWLSAIPAKTCCILHVNCIAVN